MPKLSRKSLSVVTFGAPLVPFAFLLWFVWRYGVNVPILDQWGLPEMFVAAREGRLRHYVLGLMFPNNEHVILVPKLIWTALAFPTGWNACAEMFVTCALALVSFIAVERLGGDSGGGARGLRSFVNAVVMFSAVQYENWLWGFQLAFLLTQTLVVVAVVVVRRTYGADFHPISEWKKFGVRRPFPYLPNEALAAAGLCAAASLSSAQGLLAWGVLAPLLHFSPGLRAVRWRIMAFWTFAATMTAVAYVSFFANGYAVAYDRSFALRHPLSALAAFVGLVGAPFAQGFPTPVGWSAALLGSGILLLLAVATVHAARRGLMMEIAPCLALAAFGLGFVALTTVGRAGVGLDAIAVTSRYLTAPALTAVATFDILRLAARNRKEAMRGYCAVAVMAVTLSAVAVPNALRCAEATRARTLQAKLMLEFSEYVDPKTDSSRYGPLFELFPLEPKTGVVRDGLRGLDRLGFRARVRDAAFIELADADAPGAVLACATIRDGEKTLIQASGTLDDSAAPPRCVVATVNEGCTFVAASPVNWTATETGGRRKWEIRFPTDFSPEGARAVKIWALFPDARRFVRLSDAVAVSSGVKGE